MTQNKGKKYYFAAALTIFILIIGSCNGQKGLRVVNDIPQIIGQKGWEQTNASLEQYYLPIVNCINTANGDGLGAVLKYTLSEEEDNVYLLKCKVAVSNRLYLELPAVTVFPDGKLILPAQPDPQGLCCADYMLSYMRLSAAGVNADFDSFGSAVYLSDMCELVGRCYNNIAGAKQTQEGVKQAAALGLYNGQESDYYLCDDGMTCEQLCTAIADLTERIQNNVFGTGGEKITSEYAVNTTGLFLDMYRECYDIGSAPDYSALASLNYSSGKEMTRADLARLFVSAYEDLCPNEEAYGEFFYDTDSIYCEKAIQYGVMDTMFCPEYFEPDYRPAKGEMSKAAAGFAWAVINELDGQMTKKPIKYQNLLICCDYWTQMMRNEFKGGRATAEVVNGRDYDWYYTQNDGTKYAAVNCMPTITCMAIKWYDRNAEISPDLLRNRYPEINGGWWMWQVAETLDKYKVKYRYRGISMENILSDLDNGRIILTQMSEKNPTGSGHCMVIYGYHRYGNTTMFYINDPDWDSGEGIMLESGYCIYIMQRFVNSYIAVQCP